MSLLADLTTMHLLILGEFLSTDIDKISDIWKQWKKPKTKITNLRKLGIPADKAYQRGNSRLGYWRIAGSPVLKCSITNERLAAAGYFSIWSCYESLHLCG